MSTNSSEILAPHLTALGLIINYTYTVKTSDFKTMLVLDTHTRPPTHTHKITRCEFSDLLKLFIHNFKVSHSLVFDFFGNFAEKIKLYILILTLGLIKFNFFPEVSCIALTIIATCNEVQPVEHVQRLFLSYA